MVCGVAMKDMKKPGIAKNEAGFSGVVFSRIYKAPASRSKSAHEGSLCQNARPRKEQGRSEEHTSELQSPCNLVCRLLLEKKKNMTPNQTDTIAQASSHTDVQLWTADV